MTMINENPQLVVIIPGGDLLEQTHRVGTVSGRSMDKFQHAGLTPVAAHVVQPPWVAECGGDLECELRQTFTVRNHDLLICEFASASAEAEYFDGAWIPERFRTRRLGISASISIACGN